MGYGGVADFKYAVDVPGIFKAGVGMIWMNCMDVALSID